MSSAVAEEFVRYQIANAPLRRYPFPHFYVQPVFPEDYYRELLANLPRTEVLKPIGETGTVGVVDQQTGRLTAAPVSEPRYIADLAVLEEDEEVRQRGHFWHDLSAWLLAAPFRELLIDKFEEGIRERFGELARLDTYVDGRFVRDFNQYLIRPHTDQQTKLVALLFYLPADDSLRQHGTTLYRPIDSEMQCDGTTRHSFDLFHKIATMPFQPNALLGFFKTDRSFHGVEEIRGERIERNVLLYNIYVGKLVKTAGTTATRRWAWPWRR
jgi:hypothetical protein